MLSDGSNLILILLCIYLVFTLDNSLKPAEVLKMYNLLVGKWENSTILFSYHRHLR